ncbi:MAG: Gfo/Idh/MocA family oxidoreductase [Armatimonadia bacterium]
MGISLGLVGLGSFGSSFAELFKRHPLVDRVALCDREPQRVARFAELESWKDKFNPRDAYESLDDICRADLDALVIITQPWLHAPQCVQAMEAGKHVYSAVPIISIPDDDEILEWCDRLVTTCQRTGLHYMLGETTCYRPEAMFCRRMAAEGAFGDFVYAEGEYFHDVDASCNLREVSRARLDSKAGQEWVQARKRYVERGVLGGPMHYPTHSTSGPVSFMKAHALKVTCYGYANRNNDPFAADSAFTNETALYQMSNGATVRICEFREVGRSASETFRVLGTRGSYRDGIWQTNHRTEPLTAKPLETRELSLDEMRDPLPPEVAAAWRETDGESIAYGGHGGSHAYLVHEFVDAVAHNRRPAISVYDAVRFMAMGVAAHKSALRDGERLDVPDWGDG